MLAMFRDPILAGLKQPEPFLTTGVGAINVNDFCDIVLFKSCNQLV